MEGGQAPLSEPRRQWGAPPFATTCQTASAPNQPPRATTEVRELKIRLSSQAGKHPPVHTWARTSAKSWGARKKTGSPARRARTGSPAHRGPGPEVPPMLG